MNELTDTIVGRALGAMGSAALTSFTAYRALFVPPLVGRARAALSRARARAAFWHARAKVPGYRDFLSARGALRPRAFDDVPVMDKDSFVRAYPLEALCVGGRLPRFGAVIDESSGSSGEATDWVRSRAERAACRRLIQFAARATFGDDSFVLLNAFALGPWATGIHVSMSLVDRCILKSVGPDAKKIVATLKRLGPGYRYVIAGYPPFLKSLVDGADIDWRDFDVCAVVGGEAMSLPLRGALENAFRRIYSSFGASDLEINMANENDFTIALRQAMGDSPALARDLCGASDTLPMVFQYDPLSYLIEQGEDRRLLFTLNRLENASPRVRYDLKDRGVVRSFADVAAVLRDHRLADLRPSVALPLLFHFGRAEHAVAFYGSKVTPTDVQAALLRVPVLAPYVAEFALHPFEDDRANKRLEIWVELKEGAPAFDEAAVSLVFQSRLAEENQDFREALRMIEPPFRPSVRLFAAGGSPLGGQDARIKRRYIV
jgi:phenylacetate-CoA ligase